MKQKKTSLFHKGLEQLGFYNKHISGLIFVKDDNDDLDVYEKLHIEESKKYKPDALFFKRFESQSSLPVAYIYDYTSIEKNISGYDVLHKKLWNACKVPFFIIFEKSEIKIFNCYQKPKNKKSTNQKFPIIEIIKYSSEITADFTASKLFSGLIWDSDKLKNKINNKNSAYESLLVEIKNLRKRIKSDSGLDENLADSLLIKFILIKYLEERKVIDIKFWKKFNNNASAFIDLFGNNDNVIQALDDLGSHFNGGILKLNDDEKEKIRKGSLNKFANFLSTKILEKQYTLWEMYSFEDLPVELISNIYEDILKNEKGVVYTPPILVNFMIDELMPLHKPQNNIKILDPSCGSGIFLVGAYKRLIQWYMKQNNWKKPNVKTLKKILSESLYGIDNNPKAVELTIFSLSLTICDVLKPEVIWNDLKFDDLREKNFFQKDFFDIVNSNIFNNKFDFIIGNPPFISKFTASANQIENIETNTRVKTPDKQIALLFLEQSFKLCKKNGFVSLIQPAGALLYNNYSVKFRKNLFKKYKCREIIDLTCLSSSLYKSANVSTVVIVFQNIFPNNNDIFHITIRETKTSKEKIYFEINKYDFHLVKYEEAIKNDKIWKINLLGGGRIKHIFSRFSSMRTLKKYLDEKVKNDGWLYQEGFNNPSVEYKKDFKEAEYLHKSDYLESKGLDIEGIDFSKTTELKYRYFEKPRPKELYIKPILLIRKIFRKEGIPIAISEKNLSYSLKIIGISNTTINELNQIYNYIYKKSIFSFLVSINSSCFLVSKATYLEKKSIDSLPFPENPEELKLNEIEEIIVKDTLDYMIEYCQGKENPQILKNTTKTQLKEFGKIYTKILNSVYKKFIPIEPIETEQFVCYPFSYGENNEFNLSSSDNLDKELINLVYNKTNENLLIKKNIRLYDDKIILLIKPKQLRYWLKSIAISDADETFSDLIKMGY